ncbi:hypothetical protein ACFL6S_15340 [Candidatus Poribacteria bacterium]
MRTTIIAMSVVFVIVAISDVKADWMFINEAENAAEWQNGSLETDAEFVKQGEGSIKWEHAINTNVTAKIIPTDWSEYTHFSMSIYSEKITDSEFVAIIESPNPAVEGMDYWKIANNPVINNRIKIDWEDSWQDFKDIPFAGMSVVRQPLGFDQISQIQFSATWDNQIPDPDAVLYIDDIYVTDGTPRPEEQVRTVDPKTALAATWGRLKIAY